MLVATCECGYTAKSRLHPDQRLDDIDQQLDDHPCTSRTERGIACPPGWNPLEWARYRFPSCAWSAEELAAHMTPALIEDMAHKLELWNEKQQRHQTKQPLYVTRDGLLVRLTEPRRPVQRRGKSRLYKVG